jgi:hypothetical protein
MSGMVSGKRRAIRTRDVRDFLVPPVAIRYAEKPPRPIRQQKSVISGRRTTLADLFDRALERMDARR